jgi:hypothetical protein
MAPVNKTQGREQENGAQSLTAVSYRKQLNLHVIATFGRHRRTRGCRVQKTQIPDERGWYIAGNDGSLDARQDAQAK